MRGSRVSVIHESMPNHENHGDDVTKSDRFVTGVLDHITDHITVSVI